ncbi:hypothetical protein VCRA2119O147_1000009 [Vibrio crassostreae]|uniref:Uncharacterized protein n=1 Tax=Vibrio crassostreae TaxID=246167 RepID=A0A822MMR4_9VIBR|nr:hypothetical protein VCRA2119O381_1430004 [Vibrio crassostreae]CAK2090790.1 hypothetical protein VCRA2116O31_460004 [Vibrio crassostreae]CAK2098860.1 hypothetical protein VCRA2117O37_490004 [Vibrio crassostreae]CAK2103078.1 hypothetical protein VCRA2116O26_470004 [Vibrio crassostreae]CAK2110003.1 hypothetical protein VCRA2113O324_480004 [Vibrio crassostreae]
MILFVHFYDLGNQMSLPILGSYVIDRMQIWVGDLSIDLGKSWLVSH